jgi:molybdate transport system regulatory protein
MLVEEMNAALQGPLVDSTQGGPGGGVAWITEARLRVVALYLPAEVAAAQAAAEPRHGI